MTGKLLKIDGYMLRWVWQALNCLSIDAILFPSIQHLAWLPQGRLQRKPKCGLTHWFKHRITRKLLKIDRYMLRGVWQALKCLSIHATYCVIVAGASPGKQKCGLQYVKTAIFCTCGSNNWETVEYGWYMLRGFWKALNCLFTYATFCVIAQGRPQGKQKCGKNSEFF